MNINSIWSWNRLFEFSGAKYTIDPQNDLAPLLSRTPSFDSPKSVSNAYPSTSRTTLSGFRSLNNCFCHLEIPTGSIHGSNWFSFSRNKNSALYYKSDGLYELIGKTEAYLVEINETVHERLKPSQVRNRRDVFNLIYIIHFPFA